MKKLSANIFTEKSEARQEFPEGSRFQGEEGWGQTKNFLHGGSMKFLFFFEL